MSKSSNLNWFDHLFSPCESLLGVDGLIEPVSSLGGLLTQSASGATDWSMPIRWNKQCQEAGRRDRVLCVSALDLFDPDVPQQWRERLFDLMTQTPFLDWLICTEKIKESRLMFPPEWMQKQVSHGPLGEVLYEDGWPANVWVGLNVSNQVQVDSWVPALISLPAPVHFLYINPVSQLTLGEFLQFEFPRCDGFLGSHKAETGYCVRCNGHETDPIHVSPSGKVSWVIASGQSGHGALPSSPDWMVSLRDECISAKVPFFFDGWGDWVPMLGQIGNVPVSKVTTTSDGWVLGFAGKSASGNQLYGRHYQDLPAIAPAAAENAHK